MRITHYFDLSFEVQDGRWSAKQLSTSHWYDISAAKHDLGYTVEVSVAEGLQILTASLLDE